MEKATKIIRLVLGGMITVLGLNGFIPFMPTPSVNEEMGVFLGALGATGYMFPMISLIKIVSGILLLLNRWVPLALVVLFTILANALLAHLFLDPAGIGMAIVAVALNGFLILGYKEKYLELAAKNK
ncbi:hypothetical protein [Fulvivirga imtechensis]|nr:hypothetical protein [Fulvivirga imtechensis]